MLDFHGKAIVRPTAAVKYEPTPSTPTTLSGVAPSPTSIASVPTVNTPRSDHADSHHTVDEPLNMCDLDGDPLDDGRRAAAVAVDDGDDRDERAYVHEVAGAGPDVTIMGEDVSVRVA